MRYSLPICAGVTCYEIFNSAETPYSCCEPPIKEIAHLRTFLNSGNRLELGLDIPEVFRTVIKVNYSVTATCSYNITACKSCDHNIVILQRIMSKA